MLKMLSTKMRTPALAAAACAAVILVASPVSAATWSDFAVAARDACSFKKGQTRGSCMKNAAGRTRELKQEAELVKSKCEADNFTQDECNLKVSEFWDDEVASL